MLLDMTVKGRLIVRREITDPKFCNDDSWFLHRVKAALKSAGKDCIKKRAYKDGNLVDDHMMYIRDRKNKWCIYDTLGATRSIAHMFDLSGEASLAVCENEKGSFYET